MPAPAPTHAPVLTTLPVRLDDPAAILDDLEAAIAGQAHYLPVPAGDRARTELMYSSQRVGQPIDDDIALVVPTSGSTGTPKGAQLTAANLVASADATHQVLGGPGHWLLALPAYHIAGIQVLVRSLVAGVDPVCLDLSHGFRIPAFAAAAEYLDHARDGNTPDAREPMYTALTPMQLDKAIETLEGITALRRFDAILIGGAALNPQLAESARKLDIRLVTTYGSAETAGGCIYDGQPLPCSSVAVESGRIMLGGATIAAGYRNMPGHEAFAYPDWPGWFATSDGGRIVDGRLEVSGRLDAVITTGGLKVHPEIIEKELLAVPGVKEACVVGVDDRRFGQAIMAAYEGSAEVGEIFDALYELPRWQLPKELLRVDELPRTSLGKIHRAGVAELFQPRG